MVSPACGEQMRVERLGDGRVAHLGAEDEGEQAHGDHPVAVVLERPEVVRGHRLQLGARAVDVALLREEVGVRRTEDRVHGLEPASGIEHLARGVDAAFLREQDETLHQHGLGGERSEGAAAVLGARVDQGVGGAHVAFEQRTRHQEPGREPEMMRVAETLREAVARLDRLVGGDDVAGLELRRRQQLVAHALHHGPAEAIAERDDLLRVRRAARPAPSGPAPTRGR